MAKFMYFAGKETLMELQRFCKDKREKLPSPQVISTHAALLKKIPSVISNEYVMLKCTHVETFGVFSSAKAVKLKLLADKIRHILRVLWTFWIKQIGFISTAGASRKSHKATCGSVAVSQFVGTT